MTANVEEELQTRFGWAGEVLAEAGYVDWGSSGAHGLSHYYIKEGDEVLAWNEKIRIRVSDHYANSERYHYGQTSVDFQVDVDSDSTREEIEARARQAIREREEYLASDQYQRFCEGEARTIGFRWNRELQCCESEPYDKNE
jgi:hypothetical protein